MKQITKQNYLQHINYFAVNIFLPLFIGLLIYIFFRSDNIIIVNWVIKHDFWGIITRLKTNSNLAYGLIYCLPNALWYFSLQSYMLLIWNEEKKYKTIIFIVLFVLVIFIEFMQKYRLIKGTFDLNDIIYILIATFALLFLNKNCLILKK